MGGRGSGGGPKEVAEARDCFPDHDINLLVLVLLLASK